MRTVKIISPRHQEPVSSVGMPVRIAHPGRRLGWRQRLHLWGAGCSLAGYRRAIPQQLYAQWDAPHERVQARATEGHLDYLTRTRPALGLQVYTTFS
jgi:hypothetical protein